MRNLRSLLLTQVLVLANVVAVHLSGTARSAQEQAENSSDTAYEIADVTPPKAVYHPDPQYTDSARKKKIHGTVVVAMIVTPDGKVRDVKVIKSLDKDLDKQAIAAVGTWRFEPATKDGKPVAVHLKAEANFRIY